MLNDVYLDSKTRNCDIAKDVIKTVIWQCDIFNVSLWENVDGQSTLNFLTMVSPI